MNPKTERLAPIPVTKEQQAEIRRRAEAAVMTVSEYVRERALGKDCPEVAQQPKAKPRRKA